jgi:hypothetical protein
MSAPDAARCAEATRKMMQSRFAFPFQRLPGPDEDGMREYFQTIKRPMDLATVVANLERGLYAKAEEWADDMRLIWANALAFNAALSVNAAAALEMRAKFERMMAAFHLSPEERWLAKIRRLTDAILGKAAEAQ